MNYYSTHGNGLQSTKKLEEKLCTISSSLALIPDEEKLNELEPGTSRVTGMEKLQSESSAQPTTRPSGMAGLRSSHTQSFGGGGRSSIRIENDGDEEPGQGGVGTLAGAQTLPCLQNSNMQMNQISNININLSIMNDSKNC